MKLLILLSLVCCSFYVFAQKIMVDGITYDVNPSTRYPIPPSKIYTKDRSITPLHTNGAHRLYDWKA